MSQSAAFNYIKRLENELIMPSFRTRLDFSILMNDETISPEDRKEFFTAFYTTIPDVEFPSINGHQKHMQVEATIALCESNIPDIGEHEEKAFQHASDLYLVNHREADAAKIIGPLLIRKTPQEQQQLCLRFHKLIRDTAYYPTFVEKIDDYLHPKNPEVQNNKEQGAFSETMDEITNEVRKELAGTFANNMSPESSPNSNAFTGTQKST